MDIMYYNQLLQYPVKCLAWFKLLSYKPHTIILIYVYITEEIFQSLQEGTYIQRLLKINQ